MTTLDAKTVPDFIERLAIAFPNFRWRTREAGNDTRPNMVLVGTEDDGGHWVAVTDPSNEDFVLNASRTMARELTVDAWHGDPAAMPLASKCMVEARQELSTIMGQLHDLHRRLRIATTACELVWKGDILDPDHPRDAVALVDAAAAIDARQRAKLILAAPETPGELELKAYRRKQIERSNALLQSLETLGEH